MDVLTEHGVSFWRFHPCIVHVCLVVEQIVPLSVSDNISSCLPCVHVHRACRVCNAS